MNAKMRNELRRSEIRADLVKLGELEVRTEEDEKAIRSATAELRDLEGAYQSLLASEQAVEPPQDTQAREWNALEHRSAKEPWLQRLVSGQKRDGVMQEYASERGFEEHDFPTALLRGVDQRRMEMRTDVPSPRPRDGAYVMTSPYLGSTFLPSAMMSLALSPQTVMAGEHAYPVVSSGLNASMLEQDTAAMAGAIAWEVTTLKPLEAVCRFQYRTIDELVYPEIEPALREEMSGALDELMSAQVIAGTGADGQADGLANQIDAATAPTMTADFNAFRRLSVDAVDSRYAASEMDLNVLVGLDTWRLASVSDKSDESDETGATYLRRMCNMFTLSAHVPSPPDQGDNENVQRVYISKARNLQRAYALPMWENTSVEVDRASSSALRRVNVTQACDGISTFFAPETSLHRL